MIVYCFTNHVNSKTYVGVTGQTLEARWKRHVTSAEAGSSYRFHCAIRKHGVEAFSVIVLEECELPEEAARLERMWVQLLGSKCWQLGYNMTDGGDGAPGRMVSEETREKHRQAQLGKKHTEETKQKMREAHLDRPPISDETRRKLSEALRGEKNPFFGKPSEQHPMFGRTQSAETRKKISESQKRRLAKRQMNKQQNTDTV